MARGRWPSLALTLIQLAMASATGWADARLHATRPGADAGVLVEARSDAAWPGVDALDCAMCRLLVQPLALAGSPRVAHRRHLSAAPTPLVGAPSRVFAFDGLPDQRAPPTPL